MSNGQAASKTKTSGFHPGVSVKNGKLYAYSEGRVIVMRGWPEMSAWTKTCRKSRWSRIRPKIDFEDGIIHSLRSRHPSQAGSPVLPSPGSNGCRDLFEEEQIVKAYFSSIPLAVRDAISPFRRSQWHLHAMAARCPDSLDLIRTNPALAYCVASCWAFTQSSSRYPTRLMRGLIGSRRRDICEALGFPQAGSSVSVLSKIPVSRCFIPWLLEIRDLLKDPAWLKTLWHLPTLNEEIMEFLTCEPLLCRATPRLLHELSENPVNLYHCMIDILLIERELGQPGNVRFHSLKQFYRVHRQLLERTRNTLFLEWNDLSEEPEVRKPDPPKPPILGSEDILALESRALLSEEAREQHNCLKAYWGSVISGTIYFYRVLKPERATLSIVQNQDGQWQIDQLLRARNEPVSEATHQAVAQWLSASR